MPAGYYAWSYGNSSCCIPTETKTVTAGTSATTVTPTEYNTADKFVKFLKSVTVNPTPSQAKTVTASRSAQTVTPDSGKLLSKVTINKYPDASGTYTPSANSSASDMGATNNYRYVNTNTVYNLGYKAGWNAAKKYAVDNYMAKAPYSTGGVIYGATALMSSAWPYSERHYAVGLNLISGDLYLSVNSSKTDWEYDIRLTKDA